MFDKENENPDNQNPDGENGADGEGEGESAGEKALRILEEMQKNPPKVDAAAGASGTPTYAQVREKIKAETGFTDAQVDFHLRTTAAAAASGRKYEIFTDMEDKHKDFKDFRKAINKELEAYPPEQHGDPVLIEKIYFMEKGKAGSKAPPPGGAPRGGNANEAGRQRVAAGYNGFEPSGGGDGGGGSSVLVGEEKELARNMGISEAAWNKAKASRAVKDLK